LNIITNIIKVRNIANVCSYSEIRLFISNKNTIALKFSILCSKIWLERSRYSCSLCISRSFTSFPPLSNSLLSHYTFNDSMEQ